MNRQQEFEEGTAFVRGVLWAAMLTLPFWLACIFALVLT